MSSQILLSRATVFDGVSSELIENASVLIEGGIICEISQSDIHTKSSIAIDCGNKFLMPGLIDCHYHAYAAHFDFHELKNMPKALLVAHAFRRLRGALHRGFTSVRDVGGGDIGLALALEYGLIEGPRFFFGGRAISQTGGHGDFRSSDSTAPLCACSGSEVIAHVVDGPENIRKFCRETLRSGAHHIKVFISGGVSSQADPLWMPQLTNEEVRAAVSEAQTRNAYVAAHCHTDEGAQRCVNLGVRTIEHGTNISEITAKSIAQKGDMFVVPTLAVNEQIRSHGLRIGLSAESLQKITDVESNVGASIGACLAAGVSLGFGSDVIGTEFDHLQSREFALRGQFQSSLDVLRSATAINAKILRQENMLGVVKVGAKADLILVRSNPLENLRILENASESLLLIMVNGKLVKNIMNLQ